MTRGKDNPVVITGAGMITALGHSAAQTWEGLISGKGGIRAIEGFDARGFGCKVAAQVRGLSPEKLALQPKWTRITDLHTYMLLKCSEDAFNQARLGSSSIAREDIAFFVGMGVVDYKLEDLVPAVLASRKSPESIDMGRFFAHGYQQIYPLFTLAMLNNISFCLTGIHLGICGENAVFSPHADAGAHALTEALHALTEERAKAALAGGVSEKVSAMSLTRAHLTEALNIKAAGEEAPCRPFSSDRAGTVLGEGCAVLGLELRARANERNVPYTTAITGYGHAFGSEESACSPTVDAIEEAMNKALDVSRLGPSGIDVVIAHGDGTQVGDQNEIAAIQRVFKASLERITVYSSKAALGYLLAAAPAVDALIGRSVLEHQIIPPVLPQVVDGLPFYVVGGTPVRRSCRRAMVNCRSSQGQSASLILEKLTATG
ncbi:MAG: beta-ketoacyl-[acyl-carrier-protein] synthase family protein [Candidatus Binatia bacterium]